MNIDRVLIKALIKPRKLSEYILIDKTMRRKYGMSFASKLYEKEVQS